MQMIHKEGEARVEEENSLFEKCREGQYAEHALKLLQLPQISDLTDAK